MCEWLQSPPTARTLIAMAHPKTWLVLGTSLRWSRVDQPLASFGQTRRWGMTRPCHPIGGRQAACQTDAEDRYAELQHVRIDRRSTGFVNAVGTTEKINALVPAL